MRVFIFVDRSGIQNWQRFCVGRLQQEYGDVNILAEGNNSPIKVNIFKKIQNKIEDKFSPVTQNKVDFSSELSPSTSYPQNGDIVLDLVGDLSSQKFPSGVRIWCALYNGHPLPLLRAIGEYEITHKCATIDVELCEDGAVLDVARYNPHFSAVRNWKTAVYSLHWLALKCLRNNTTPSQKILKKNSPVSEIVYTFSFYKSIFNKYAFVFANGLLGYYQERWTIGLSKGNYLSDGTKHLKVLNEPQHEFWADPFLYHHCGLNKTVLFIERFPFKEKKGVISCAEVDENLDIHNMHDILVKDYHFSYPHIIEENGDLYMMPESSANHQLEVYRCISFPDQWKLHTTALHGERVADTVYYEDKNKDSWIFTTYCDSSIDLHCTMLMIYKVDSIHLKKLTPHHKNPILIDSSCARNGGRIYEENGKIYRVSQDNTHGLYGYGINVHEIIKLSLDDFPANVNFRITA